MISQKRIQELVSYEPDTGLFRWRVRPTNRVHVGDIAGSVGNNGYRQIRLDGVLFQAHRLAWAYMTGNFPVTLLDHKDLDRDNNRFKNLRLATESQNSSNAPMRKHNRTGLKGVGLHSKTGKYRARIRVENVEYHLGLFDTASEAYAAYCEASKKYHGDFGRLK